MQQKYNPLEIIQFSQTMAGFLFPLNPAILKFECNNGKMHFYSFLREVLRLTQDVENVPGCINNSFFKSQWNLSNINTEAALYRDLSNAHICKFRK